MMKYSQTASQMNTLQALGWMAALGMVSYLAGCASSRQTRQEDDDFYARLPPVTISSTEIIHSPAGDMTARLPHGWVTVEVEKLEDPKIFAVACDPNYTMSLVFSEVALDNSIRTGFDRGGMRGVLEASFLRRQKRSAGRAQGMTEVEEFTIGSRQFGSYIYTTDSMRTITRVAVFYTTAHLYECAIT